MGHLLCTVVLAWRRNISACAAPATGDLTVVVISQERLIALAPASLQMHSIAKDGDSTSQD